MKYKKEFCARINLARGKVKLSRGLRKYIRQEKARIRREVFGVEEQKKLIKELYRKVR